ncbi:MAG: hypothetical protein P4M08_05495 [Oligoflexia bacterium]|nr:hypothetical protein [Oligoflexia bacterium]
MSTSSGAQVFAATSARQLSSASAPDLLTALNPVFLAASRNRRHYLATGIQNNMDYYGTPAIDAAFSATQIPSLGAAWYREAIRDRDLAPNFAEIVRQAHLNHMKVMATIFPDDADYNSTADASQYSGSQFVSSCGYAHVGAVSKLNLEKFQSRLSAYFQAVQQAGQNIEAIEVGNEMDTVCFNADVPWGTVATAAQTAQILQSYAAFFSASVSTIKIYFPYAVILPFAPADIPSTGWVGYHLNDSLNFISSLSNVNGVNYLALTNGVALHIYPSAENPLTTISSTGNILMIDQTRQIFGAQVPIYITEWGYNQASNRAAEMTQFLKAVSGYNSSGPILAAIYWAYNWESGKGTDLVDATGKILPEAFLLGQQW